MLGAIAHAAAMQAAPYSYLARPLAPGASYGALTSEPIAFEQAAKFGAMSASLVLGATLLGFAFDKEIADRLNIADGWGPVVGAVGALTLTNAVAGLSQSTVASAGYAFGGLLPLIPVGFAAYVLNKPASDKTTTTLLSVVAGGTVVYGIYKAMT